VIWLFGVLGVVAVVVVGLVLVGRETARLALAARPAVFDLAEAVEFIADRLPAEVQARISHDDVRWVLLADADLLEDATTEHRTKQVLEGRELPGGGPDQVVDEDLAVGRVIEAADAEGREIADVDIAAVLSERMAYLEAIGAVGPQAWDADELLPPAEG
jgi:hypothetical protein